MNEPRGERQAPTLTSNSGFPGTTTYHDPQAGNSRAKLQTMSVSISATGQNSLVVQFLP
jgi:hypothetical protein